MIGSIVRPLRSSLGLRLALPATGAAVTADLALGGGSAWGAVAVGGVTAATVLLTLRAAVSGRLAALGAYVRRLGGGEYDEAPDVSGEDELGALARALDGMRRALGDQHADQLLLLEQLSSALQRAQAADVAKGRFLATVSHEVRTPLNGIIGMAGLLELTELDAEQRQLVATLISSGRALLALVDDVLDFSTLDSHDVELCPAEVDVAATAREVLELAVANRGLADVRARVRVAADVPRFLRCDSIRLRQVLSIVVGNAAKYTRAGSIEVRLEVLPRPAGGPRELLLRCEVEDTGLGIAREDLRRIFLPFSQVDDSDSRSFGGTGLGLAIARQVVELMGGEMGVRSEPGAGSTFWFTARVERSHVELERRATLEALGISRALDATVRPIAAGPGALLSGDGAGDPPPADGRPHVLVAEDNPVNQALARRALERDGYRVAIAEDGVEALERFRTDAPDLVLMDCQMPRLDGFAATRRIRELELERGSARTPIVAVTANAMPGDRERCLEHGMDDYLAKPYRPADLSALVSRWLDRAARGAP